MARLALLLAVALAAVAAAQAAEKAPLPEGAVGVGTDGKYIWKDWKSYQKWADTSDEGKAFAASPTAQKKCKLNPKYNITLDPRVPVRGVPPEGACEGEYLPMSVPPPPKEKKAPKDPKPVKYNPPVSKGFDDAEPWEFDKPSEWEYPPANYVKGVKTASTSGVTYDNCPGLPCLSGNANLGWSLKLKTADGEIDIGAALDPLRMIQDFANFLGRGLCNLSARGADISSGQWLANLIGSDSSLGSKLGSYAPLFKGMPLDPNTYYLLFALPIGSAFPLTPKDGVDPSTMDKVKKALGVTMFMAVNPCTADIHFQFEGLETPQIPLGSSGFGINLGVKAFSFSRDGKAPASHAATGLNQYFWRSFRGFGWLPQNGVFGHIYFSGYGKVAKMGEAKNFDISVTANLRLMINYDPNRDGAFAGGDFQILMTGDAAPSMKLGPITVPLDKIFKASANMYIGNSRADGWAVAATMNITTGGLGDLLGVIPGMPDAAKSALNKIFSGGTPAIPYAAVYGGTDSWGIRVHVNFTGALASVIGAILGILKLIWSNVPDRIDPRFAIMGKSSGNGLPIGITLGLANVGEKTFYFCNDSNQCPGGSACQLGLCAKTDCGSRTSPSSAITCNLRPCLPGWTNIGLACLKDCSGSEVNQGLTCASCDGQEYQAGLCYNRCNGGYYPVGPVCWQYCGGGWSDWGAICKWSQGAYGKGCCCHWWFWSWRCCGNCGGNMTDSGCICFPNMYWKPSYGRGAGRIPRIFGRSSESRIVIPTIYLP